jgi:hypothetical protein
LPAASRVEAARAARGGLAARAGVEAPGDEAAHRRIVQDVPGQPGLRLDLLHLHVHRQQRRTPPVTETELTSSNMPSAARPRIRDLQDRRTPLAGPERL